MSKLDSEKLSLERDLEFLQRLHCSVLGISMDSKSFSVEICRLEKPRKHLLHEQHHPMSVPHT